MVAGSVYVIWLITYNVLIKNYTNWDFYLNYNIAYLSIGLLDLFGFDSVMEIDSDHVIISLIDSFHKGVWVGDNCNGFKLFSIFSIFIIAYPSNWKSKMWYIPLGILVVHFANVIRIVALVLINNSNPIYLDFNHDYTFTIFVYSIIFGLWYFWLKKFSLR
jgi:exosortase/archaeosortase family protein